MNYFSLKQSITHCSALILKSPSEIPVSPKFQQKVREEEENSSFLHFSGSGITLMALERNVACINDLKTDPPGKYTINEPGLLNSSAVSLLNYS